MKWQEDPGSGSKPPLNYSFFPGSPFLMLLHLHFRPEASSPSLSTPFLDDKLTQAKAMFFFKSPPKLGPLILLNQPPDTRRL